MTKTDENSALLVKYPIYRPWFFFPQPDNPSFEERRKKALDEYDYSYTMIDMAPKGWKKLMLELGDELQAYLRSVGHEDDFSFYDIKEKFGWLRLSPGGYDDYRIDEILSKYEMKSLLVCPYCGKPSKYITSGWISYVCEDCAKDPALHLKSRPLCADDRPEIERVIDGKTVVEYPLEQEFKYQWSHWTAKKEG